MGLFLLREYIYSSKSYSSTDMSRRGSAEGGSGGGESEVVVLKRRRLVAAAPLYAGLARFNFLLDATQPGGTPDALFMAALLDLVSVSADTLRYSKLLIN